MVLIDVLRNDPKPGVRSEAAQSLSKLRPVSQPAGHALEQAMQNDASMRVRLQARSALLMYHWAGFHTTKLQDAPLLQTKEPPLAPSLEPSIVIQPQTATQTRLGPKPKESAAPPLAPAEPPLLRTAPARPIQGPELIPFN